MMFTLSFLLTLATVSALKLQYVDSGYTSNRLIRPRMAPIKPQARPEIAHQNSKPGSRSDDQEWSHNHHGAIELKNFRDPTKSKFPSGNLRDPSYEHGEIDLQWDLAPGAAEGPLTPPGEEAAKNPDRTPTEDEYKQMMTPAESDVSGGDDYFQTAGASETERIIKIRELLGLDMKDPGEEINGGLKSNVEQTSELDYFSQRSLLNSERSRQSTPKPLRKRNSALQKKDKLRKPSGLQQRDITSAVQNTHGQMEIEDKDHMAFAGNRAMFEAYLQAYNEIRSEIIYHVLPTVERITNQTNSTLVHDAAWQALAEIAGFPLLFNGPFRFGRNRIPAIQKLVFNGTENSVEKMSAKSNRTETENGVLKIFATLDRLWDVYNDVWTNGTAAANITGLLATRNTLASYLLPKDRSIMTKDFQYSVDPTWLRILYYPEEPPLEKNWEGSDA